MAVPRDYWEPLFDPALGNIAYLASVEKRTTPKHPKAFGKLETVGYAPAIAGLCVMIAFLAGNLTTDTWYPSVGKPHGPGIRNILSTKGQARIRAILDQCSLRRTDLKKAILILEKETKSMAPVDALLLLMQDCALEIREAELII